MPNQTSTPPGKNIAIIGSGLIGRSWAIAFARGNCNIRLYDRDPALARKAIDLIAEVLPSLADNNLLGGKPPAQILSQINACNELHEAIADAQYVQENTPENLQTKRAIFAELDSHCRHDAILASSTSAILPSKFSGELPGATRCLVAHPLNPPHLCAAVELVPSSATSTETVARAKSLMLHIGQQPIVVNREIEGFVLNRLQGAILDEAFKLVAEGYASIQDVDTAIKYGLALRWSFMGPFETIDLNAPGGVADFLNRYDEAYKNIGAARVDRHDWSGELAESITAVRRDILPIEELASRQLWRDQRLAELVAHKLKMDETLGS
jgi:L-gulonate 3-dehydrogenase